MAGVWCKFIALVYKQRLVSWDSDALLIPPLLMHKPLVRLDKRVSLSGCNSCQSINCSDCSGEDYLSCEAYLEVLQSE